MQLDDLRSVTNRVPLASAEQGAMSCVETAMFKGRKVVIKTLLRPDEPYDIKQFRAEIDALKALKLHALSKFVVELIAYCESPLAVILEHCEGGTLFTYRKHHPNQSWKDRMMQLGDVVTGLLALHKREWEEQDKSKRSFSQFKRVELFYR